MRELRSLAIVTWTLAFAIPVGAVVALFFMPERVERTYSVGCRNGAATVRGTSYWRASSGAVYVATEAGTQSFPPDCFVTVSP